MSQKSMLGSGRKTQSQGFLFFFKYSLPSFFSLHTDNKFNLFCQIRGAKYFILVDPASTAPVPTLSNLMFNSSDLDVEAEVKMPESKYILRECVVKEGDVLYIPKLYWHYVKSLSASVSISVWFDYFFKINF